MTHPTLDLLLRLLLRALVAAGLVVDAVIHARLAPGYQLGQPGGIGEGNLFRIEAAVAGLFALAALLRNARRAAGRVNVTEGPR